MGRIDEALASLEATENGTERALQLAGLISTLFKIKSVALVLTGRLAFDAYARTESRLPSVELSAFAGKLAPRAILEIMRGQLYGQGSIYDWTVAGIPVRFRDEPSIAYRELCRDFTTDHGVIKLMPVEEITAEWILAAFFPEPDEEAYERAQRLVMEGLTEIFPMNWTVLHALCHRPDYRVGEELAQMRLVAKKEVDELGLGRDHIGETSALPKVTAPLPVESPMLAPEPVTDGIIDMSTLDPNALAKDLPESA